MIAAFALAVLVQDGAPDLRLHVDGVLQERREAFATAWEGADDSAREAARGLFLRRLRLGFPAVVELSPLELGVASRVLRGEFDADAPAPFAQRLADALDVRLVPGALEADAATDALLNLSLVHDPGLDADAPEAVTVVVRWRRPDGGASPEPIVLDLVPRGLVGAPRSVAVPVPELAAGTWFLVPEVVVEEERAIGYAVPVEVVDELFERLDARPVPEGSPLDQLLRFGVRDARRSSVARWLAGGRAPARPGPVAELYPVEPPPARAAVVRALPARTWPAWALSGVLGAPWREELVERGVAVVGLGEGASLEDVLAAARHRVPSRPLVLVVDASRVGDARSLLQEDRRAFDRLVVLTASRHDGATVPVVDVPTLVVRCLADGTRAPRAVGGAAALVEAPHRGPPLVAARAVPAWIADWLELPEEPR